MHRAYLALGSNLNQPESQLRACIDTLRSEPQIRVLEISSFYHSKPMGPVSQPDFVNAVVAIDTTYSPQELLTYLKTLEQKQGRQPDRHWGPRLIDCDILLFDDIIMNSDTLTLPHPGLYSRDFVLKPLAEIAPSLTLPNGCTAQACWQTRRESFIVTQ